ncbi:MAG: IS3 family transposase [Oscillospiraceae bacterium]
MDSAGESFEAIRAALADRNNILTVKDLCELAGVSRSGYYNWVRSEKTESLREAKDRAAFEQILEAYRFRGYAKGVRGIHMRLLHMGIRMNVKKIRRLMRKYKLTCPIRKPNPYRRLQRSIRMGSAAENLVNREFESHGPRAILLTDITYIPLCGRFCYLSTILDACTKQVLAYAMSESLEVDFVLETVQSAGKAPWDLAEQGDRDPQRPGDPLHQSEVHPAGGEQRVAAVHVPQRELLGQRAPRELLRAHEGRAGQ